MTARKLTLALSILALAAGGNAFAAEFNFLKPGQVDLTKLVPPPPAIGSEAEKQDMAGGAGGAEDSHPTAGQASFGRQPSHNLCL